MSDTTMVAFTEGRQGYWEANDETGLRVRPMADGTPQVEGTFTIGGTDYDGWVGFYMCDGWPIMANSDRVHIRRPVMSGKYNDRVPPSRINKAIEIAHKIAMAFVAQHSDALETCRQRHRGFDIDGMRDDLATVEKAAEALRWELKKAEADNPYDRWVLGNLPREWSEL